MLWTINPVEKGQELFVILNCFLLAISFTLFFYLLTKLSVIASILNFPIASVLSVLAAIFSAYYAYKAIGQNRMSQIPILEAYVGDVSDSHVLYIKIQNVGNGIAKNITAKLLPMNEDISFGSDLMPRKYSEFNELYFKTPLIFNNGDNPLFEGGELQLAYEDIWGNKYQTRSVFKPDVDLNRKSVGHIDVNLAGSFYH
jgi:hypothetical protein